MQVIRAKKLEASGKLGWIKVEAEVLAEVKILAAQRRMTIRALVDKVLRAELGKANEGGNYADNND